MNFSKFLLVGLVLSNCAFAQNWVEKLSCDGGLTRIQEDSSIVVTHYNTVLPQYRMITNDQQILSQLPSIERNVIIGEALTRSGYNPSYPLTGGYTFATIGQEMVALRFEKISGDHVKFSVSVDELTRCVESVIISGCYAGEDHCEIRCLREEVRPAKVYLEKVFKCKNIFRHQGL